MVKNYDDTARAGGMQSRRQRERESWIKVNKRIINGRLLPRILLLDNILKKPWSKGRGKKMVSVCSSVTT